MTEIKYKVVERKNMKEQVIGRWLKPAGFNLYCVDISIPLYGLNFQLTFGTIEEFARYIKQKHDRDVDHQDAQAMYCWYTIDKKVHKYLIFTNNEWRADDYGTIAHEVHHAIHYSLGDLGCVHSKDSEESYAYLMGYTMSLIVRALSMLNLALDRDRKKKRKKSRKK